MAGLGGGRAFPSGSGSGGFIDLAGKAQADVSRLRIIASHPNPVRHVGARRFGRLQTPRHFRVRPPECPSDPPPDATLPP